MTSISSARCRLPAVLAGLLALAACDAAPVPAPVAAPAAQSAVILADAFAPRIGEVAPEGEVLRRSEARGDAWFLAFQFPFFNGRYQPDEEQVVLDRFVALFISDNCRGVAVPQFFASGGSIAISALRHDGQELGSRILDSCEGVN